MGPSFGFSSGRIRIYDHFLYFSGLSGNLSSHVAKYVKKTGQLGHVLILKKIAIIRLSCATFAK